VAPNHVHDPVAKYSIGALKFWRHVPIVRLLIDLHSPLPPGVSLMSNHCRFRDRCPMYPNFRNEFGLEVFKKTYCNVSHHDRCERYKLATQGKMPEPDLLPNGRRMILPGTGAHVVSK
jgi:hypothetical protein